MIISASQNNLQLRLPLLFSGVIISVLAGAGCNVLTSYIDRDIDKIMNRTKNRPLPSRRIEPPVKSVYFGLLLLFISLSLALMQNFLSFLCILIGAADNIVIYGLLIKRRSPLNIIIGGFSGGFAPLFGWTYISNSINMTALLISSIIILWIPSHVWALAITYRTDYQRVRVPMLPVLVGEKKAIKGIISTLFLLIIVSIALLWFGGFSTIYLSLVMGTNIIVLLANVYLFNHPSKDLAWKMFKISSPHLLVLFAGMIIDLFLRSRVIF
jgi:protoheme IX farnesyltransferase